MLCMCNSFQQIEPIFKIFTLFTGVNKYAQKHFYFVLKIDWDKQQMSKKKILIFIYILIYCILIFC